MKLLRLFSVAIALCSAAPAFAQTAPPFRPGVNVQETNPQPTKSMCYVSSAWVPCVNNGDANGTFVVGKGGSSISTGQIAVGTTATLIVPARVGRQKVAVTVTSATQCAFGNSNVTLSTGWPLAAVAYAADNWDTAAPLYGVCSAGATVAYRELY